MKRKISLILAICMLFTAIPFSAFAAAPVSVDYAVEGDWPDEDDILIEDDSYLFKNTLSSNALLSNASPSDASSNNALYSNAKIASPNEVKLVPTTDEILSMVKGMLLELASEQGGSALSWATDKFLKKLFPNHPAGQLDTIQRMLSEVLANQEKMMQSLDKLSDQVSATSLADKLNEYKKVAQTGTAVENAWRTLENLDKSSYTGDELKNRRMFAVTDGIGITPEHYGDGATNLEDYVNKLTTLITMPYDIVLPDGSHATMDLAQIHYEYTRLDPQYLFEHEAYDELISFQAYVYGNFMLAASVQKLSLYARQDYCEEKGIPAGNIEAALDKLTDNIEAVEKSLKRTNVERQDVYRYFWVPGYEVKMYVQTDLHLKPRESKWSDTYQRNHLGTDWCYSDGFVGKNPEADHNKAFWHKFWTYGGQDKENVLTGEQYQKLMEGTKKRNSSREKSVDTLYKLLFEVGGLKKGSVTHEGKTYTAGDSDSYMFMPDKKYPFTNNKRGNNDYHLYSKGISNRKIKDGFSATTIDFGTYQTKMGDYLAYQDRNLENNRYILVAEFEDDNSQPDEVVYIETATRDDSPAVILPDIQPSVSPDKAVTPITVAANGNQMLGNAIISIAIKNLTAGEKQQLVENAVWTKDAKGYWYLCDKDGKKYQNCWVLLADTCGNSPVGNASWYYFGPDGAMLTGWQKIKETDGKENWYYFNKEAGSMYGACLLSGTTPDGYTLDEKGKWTK